MKHPIKLAALPNLCILCIASVAAATTSTVMAQTSEMSHPTADVLAAMDRTPTEGHPDQFHEFAGMRKYVGGDYKGALSSFKESARYADKLSQLSIGLMYLNGQGVQKDPVAAFAWTAIAAERKYPSFVATRDKIWAQLDAQQQERAKALVANLYAEYGDEVAKPRMERALRQGLSQKTGSYLGFHNDAAVMTANQYTQGGPPPSCGAPTIDGAPMVGCGDTYVDWRWEPKRYFQVRDAMWSGTVTVGALQPLDSKDIPTKQADSKTGTP